MNRGALLALVGPLVAILALPLFAAGSVAGGGQEAGLPIHADVPPVAMRAYVAAAASAGSEEPACALSWALLAGIGKVESNHGRHGGGRPAADGTVRPPIIGIALDGRPGVAAIADTDGGRLDGDTDWDRAVGPMQFIPTSWRRHGADGNHDGLSDPQNLFDAAAAAVSHLCGGQPADLTTTAAIRAALRGYNNSAAYGRRVMSWMQAYLAGAVTPDAAGPGSGPIACPVLPPVTFIDSWGFPRSGGRTHEGQDLFAVHGQPLLAVDDGQILSTATGRGLGGTILWLGTDAGHAWYYAHLSGFAAGIETGATVRRGQVVGYTGNTGNARTTPPHLHIQWRPAGRRGADVNPYALLDAACPGH